MNKKTQEDFIIKLKEEQLDLFNSIEILTEYKTAKESILVKDKYGICSVRPDNLLHGKYPTIKSAVDRDEYFARMVKIRNPKIFDNIIGFGKYEGMLTNIKIYTKYGDCEMQPVSILEGSQSSLKSAVNKIEYISNTLKESYPKVYNSILEYGEYKGYHNGMLVRDKYGWCKVHPSNLLMGKCPTIESSTDKNEYFKNKAVEVHGNFYDYSKIDYVNKSDKICIVCPNHDEFWQNPDNHLYGYGCEQCGYENGLGGYNKTNAERNKEVWKNIDAVVYTIFCKSEDESFYKIGITTQNSVYDRFYARIPYQYEELYNIKTNLYDAVYLENKLHDIFKNNSYKPQLYFGGWTECFSEVDLDFIKSIQL